MLPGNGVTENHLEYVLSFDRACIVIDAALHRLDIALDSKRTAETFLKNGSLIEIFDGELNIAVHAHHLVYSKRQAQWPCVEKFTTWLKNEAAL